MHQLQEGVLVLGQQLKMGDVNAFMQAYKAKQVDTIDMCNLAQIDSAGLAAIITALKPRPSKPITLANCTEQARALIELYQLRAFFYFSEPQ